MFTPRIQCCVCINIHELVPISPFYQVCDGNCTFRTVTVSKKRPGSVKPHFMVNLHGSADTGLKYNKEIMGGGRGGGGDWEPQCYKIDSMSAK